MRILGAVAAILMSMGCGDSTQPTPVAPSSADPPTPAPAPAPVPDPTARYRVTFDATWSATTHPANGFPSNPHFSDLVGATHERGFHLWEDGSIASNGIEAMAELGATTPLDDEIERAIANGRAEHLLLGGGIALSPGTVVLDFDVSIDRPSVTLVSMLAPSPDWFVGVNDLDLLEEGDWIDELVIGLAPYDAGTDSGSRYSSADRDTVPREPIAHITTAPLAANGTVLPVGTFTFRRQ